MVVEEYRDVGEEVISREGEVLMGWGSERREWEG